MHGHMNVKFDARVYLCFKLIFTTNSTKHSPPWETSSWLVNQNMPYVLWNQMVHSILPKSLPLFPFIAKWKV